LADGLENRVLLAKGAGTSSLVAHPLEVGTTHHNIVYTTLGGFTEKLDVTLPRGTPPPGGWPVLLAIHGGGWRRYDKAEYGPRIAKGFVRHGYAVVAPNYVLSAPGFSTWPLNLEDIQSAVRWVRENATELGLNPNQIVAIGESAGANLAALAGTDPGPAVPGEVSDKVNAVIAFSTPTDLTELDFESPLAAIAVNQFLGGTPSQVPQNYADASPIDHVSASDPPMLLVHGLQDPLIPVSQARQMAAALTAAGVRNQLILVNGGHDLDFPVNYANLIPQILEFLSATWNDTESP
jgi:acetyl esterase/lipase